MRRTRLISTKDRTGHLHNEQRRSNGSKGAVDKIFVGPSLSTPLATLSVSSRRIMLLLQFWQGRFNTILSNYNSNLKVLSVITYLVLTNRFFC